MEFVEARDALDIYKTVTAFVDHLAPDDFFAQTRCRGWVVNDLLFHMVCDAQRALVAFATPSDAPPDVDFASYWEPFRAGDEGQAAHARWVRVSASALSPAGTKALWSDTAPAVLRAADTIDPAQAIATQGHVMSVTDFLATLAVEAAVHYLDLTVEFPDAPTAPSTALMVVRRTLDARLGNKVRAPWDDATYALKATGRIALSKEDLIALGGQEDRLPLFG